jgi:hypothetical protein
MEPRKLGRTLGIGVRVASNMVRERLEQNSQSAQNAQPSPVNPPRSPQTRPAPGSAPIPISHKVASQAVNARRGIRAFGQALVTPFTHAGGILWLEITGLFFAMFALFFAQGVYRLHSAWNQPGEQLHLLLYVILTLGFGWFSVSSFVRARQKTKRGPTRRT